MKPYKELAYVYDGHWGNFSKNYLLFLNRISKKGYPVEMSYVLDLACGTGVLISLLAGKTKKIVGLDISTEMLEVAHQNCRHLKNVEWVHGDFRSFQLGIQFNLILCCFDALNYIEKIEELGEVFQCVREHLHDQGFFVFDVVNDKHFLKNNGFVKNFNMKGQQWTVLCTYQKQFRAGETLFIFKNGVEKHRQIAIEYDDIVNYSKREGLEIVDGFSGFKLQEIQDETTRFFFVMRRQKLE